MPENAIWVIKSKHRDPNDFYVKVDGSEFYIATWVALAKNKDNALSMTETTLSELELGNAEIIEIYSRNAKDAKEDAEIYQKILDTFPILNGQEDVQLAAWKSSNGGLW